jgi:hypothetical protein
MKNLRRLIRENLNWVLDESMDMMVSDHGYEDDLDNILDICHYVIKKVANDLYPKLGLSDEEKKKIGGIGDDFTPDGSDAFEQVGTMNFYVGNWSVDKIEKVLGYIKYILGEKDIELGDMKWERVKDKIDPKDFGDWGITDGGESFRVIRIPIVKNGAAGQVGNPPVVNFSNTYANKIFGEILGFEGDGGGYSMNTADLLMKLNVAKKEMVTRTDIPDTVQHSVSGNIHNTINGKDYYFRAFDRIEEFAKWANKHGYNKITVA